MSQITQEEYIKISDLLHSDNVHEIMTTINICYAGTSSENCSRLLTMISEISKAALRKKDKEVLLNRKCVETLEYMVPNNYKYPYGMYGVLTYVYCRCNFKQSYLDSKDESSHKLMVKARRAMQGNPGAKAVLPQFIDYIEFCSKNPDWKNDSIWGMLESEVKDMTEWCIQNRDKWDDYTKSDIEKQLNLEANGII